MSAQEMRSASDRFTSSKRGFRQVRSALVVAADPELCAQIVGVLHADDIDVVAAGPSAAAVEEHASEDSSLAVVLAGGPTRNAWRRQIAEVLQRIPGARLIALAGFSTALGVRKTLEAGAAGLVFQGELHNALAPTVRAVLAGQVVVPDGMRSVAIHPALSYREKQVLAMVAEGYTNYQIGAELYLAESTVKSHLSSIFQKLRVHSRSEAAALLQDPRENVDLLLPAREPVAGVSDSRLSA
jgi:DNA-binding NarL/FixJ family response regulator